jgi:hypothetical protein
MRAPFSKSRLISAIGFFKTSGGLPGMAAGSGAAQLPQKWVSAGLSNWHFGHLTAMVDPFSQVWLKIIKELGG